jgi:hypothetical protein
MSEEYGAYELSEDIIEEKRARTAAQATVYTANLEREVRTNNLKKLKSPYYDCSQYFHDPSTSNVVRATQVFGSSTISWEQLPPHKAEEVLEFDRRA